MSEISEAKKQLRLNAWSEMYRSYRESGKTVLAWCRERDISSKTFYYRLRKVRENMLKSQEHHEIVPIQANNIEAVSVLEAALQSIVVWSVIMYIKSTDTQKSDIIKHQRGVENEEVQQ